VQVYEVGPRDGLQNEAASVSRADKLRLVKALSLAGISKLELTSFVSPRWIPALADAGELSAEVLGDPELAATGFSALVPNLKGLERLLAAGFRECAVLVSASETHNKKNLNASIEDSMRGYEAVIAEALARGLLVRGYLSMVWGCPWEGDVPVERVQELSERLLELGCYQISLGDTVGYGTPGQTVAILERLFGAGLKSEELAMHMHDTRGMALANCVAGLELGVTTFDAAIGGLGGCPYAKGASGNLATEDLVYLLHGLGIQTGVSLEALIDAALLAQSLVGHPLPGRYFQARLAERGA